MKMAPKLLIYFLLISLVPLAVISTIFYQNTRQGIEQNILNYLETINYLKLEDFNRWIASNENSIEELAQRPLVKENAGKLATHDESQPTYTSAHDSLIKDHLSPRLRYGNFTHLSLICPVHGVVLASTYPDWEGMYRDDRNYYIEGKKSTYVEGVYYSSSLEQSAITLSTPVRDSAGNLVGVLAGYLDLNELSRIMEMSGSGNKPERTYLVNSFNFLVTDPVGDTSSALKKSAHSQGIDASLNGQNGKGSYEDYRGVPVMGAYTWIPNYRMSLLTEIEQSEAFAQVLQLSLVIILIFLLFAVIIAVIAVLFARGITHPVRVLIKGTGEFSTGNLDYRINTKSRDEIGMLARSFNKMASDLKAITVSRDDLENEVNQRKRAERILSELSSRQEAILAAVPDIIMEVDINKVYTWANRAGLDFFGDDVVGKEASFYFEGEQETYSKVQPLFDGDKNIIYVESWQRRNDGQKRLLAWWCRVLQDKDRKVTGALSAARDITEQKLAEDEITRINEDLEQRIRLRTFQLEASNKELEAFAYSVSHDLRAPLRAIDGYSRILVEDFGPDLDDEANRICSIIRENTHNMGNLIDDLLSFSRLGRTEMQKSLINMGTMANSMYYELTDEENRKHISFMVNSVPDAIGDPTLMRQVWANLLSNAIKFSSKKDHVNIRISGQRKDSELFYTIQDNGSGFDMQYVHKLFGVFQRLHSKSEFEGNGVGLAIVQRIINRHGGRVWAQAEVDRGASFYFTLPVKGEET